MSSTWTGSALRTRYAQKYGYTDTTNLARVLEWMNEIQDDMCSEFDWSFLKMKMKRSVVAGEQEIDISPQVPTAPILVLLAGGSLTADSAVYVKVTFVLFDESGKEFASIESEPSIASNTVTPITGSLSLTIIGIDTFDGSTSVQPARIHRRLYLKQGSGDFVLAKTLTDNVTTTTTITANPTSLIEPPEHSMIECMSGEDPVIELSGRTLYESKLDDILKYDPNLTATGVPQYYARTAKNKIFLYPKPSGSLAADFVYASGVTASGRDIRQDVTVTLNQLNTLSVFAKAGTANFISLQISNASNATNNVLAEFNLADGTISVAAINSGTATGAVASISAHPDGWYECSLSGIADVTGTDVRSRIGVRETSGSVVVTDGLGLYMWGAYLGVNGPFKSNLFTFPNDFDNAAWVKSNTAVTENAVASPDTALTLSYWIKKRPARIFADTDRVIQLPADLKPVLDAGVTWKGYEYKDSDGQETKLSNYTVLRDAAGIKAKRTGGQAMKVKVVC
jgi:hypothetical protein